MKNASRCARHGSVAVAFLVGLVRAANGTDITPGDSVAAAGSDSAAAPMASTSCHTLTIKITGAKPGQQITVLNNGRPLTIAVAPSDRTVPFSKSESVQADTDYNVTLQSGWHGTSLKDGTYCYVRKGQGIANHDVSIRIQCGPAPSSIVLSGVQYGQSYRNWSLAYPAVVNGELFYEVLSNGGPLIDTMAMLGTLFDGRATNSTRDNPVELPDETNLTTLRASSLIVGGSTVSTRIPVLVELPTITQLGEIYTASGNKVPAGWYYGFFWSSTEGSSGTHFVEGMNLTNGFQVGLSDYYNFHIAFRVL
ncbi:MULTISPECIES: hypothetical protein [Paraburkholderia]|uniref:Uncharacterized protein n=1 Tax=Paraburkholderia dipogonis TaxID=1211383 RepID=A0A4Y8MHA2_9BURK|nr:MULTISPECIES: hypothetical protein [Paraburkholderia]RKR31262.1 hypothetical protein B0G82_7397 [Paraburkholderia sp. BL17N1]TFE36763.1 hypothetical protein E2553_44720 [Paraburkholderia dipogonis]